jgi:redox-sensing transcriptional repressor
MNKIPEPTLKRVFLYYRVLNTLQQENINTTSSTQLADLVDVSSAQVRKDLAFFGSFGKRGHGYSVVDMIEQFQKILNLDKLKNVAIVGVGKLGSALLRYKAFSSKNLIIKASFDVNLSSIGKKVSGIECFDMDNLESKIKEENIKMIMLTVPDNVAQEIVDRIVNTNVKAILNFTPITLMVPKDIKVSNVDLSIELQTLSYYVSED